MTQLATNKYISYILQPLNSPNNSTVHYCLANANSQRSNNTISVILVKIISKWKHLQCILRNMHTTLALLRVVVIRLRLILLTFVWFASLPLGNGTFWEIWAKWGILRNMGKIIWIHGDINTTRRGKAKFENIKWEIDISNKLLTTHILRHSIHWIHAWLPSILINFIVIHTQYGCSSTLISREISSAILNKMLSAKTYSKQPRAKTFHSKLGLPFSTALHLLINWFC